MHNSNNNNSIHFFNIYVPSQQIQGQLQTQKSVIADNNNNSNNRKQKYRYSTDSNNYKIIQFNSIQFIYMLT
jgi:hypothetical protein